MFSIDYTNIIILVVMLIFFLSLNVAAIIKKKADYAMIVVLLSIAIFVLHVINRNVFTPQVLMKNAFVDFTVLAISIPILLVVDEIEMRRSIIKNVFHKKYENKK